VRLAAAAGAEQGEVLARSEAEMRALFSCLPDLVLQMRGDGTILRLVNTRFRLRSPRPGNLPGRSVAELFSAESAPALLAAATAALGEDRPGAISLELRQDGERLWFSATVSPLGPDAVLLVCRDVSDLIRSERKYRDLVEQASCLILRLDAEGNVVFLNDYAERFFGHPADALLGRSALGAIVPDDPERARHFRRMLAEIATHPEEYLQDERENLTRDGRLVWVSWNCRPVFEDGRPAGVLCVGADMTERRASRDKLLRRERYFGALIANSSDLTTVVDALGRVAFEAPAVRLRLGFAPDQQVGRALVDMIHPEDRPAFTQAMAALAQTPEAHPAPGVPPREERRLLALAGGGGRQPPGGRGRGRHRAQRPRRIPPPGHGGGTAPPRVPGPPDRPAQPRPVPGPPGPGPGPRAPQRRRPPGRALPGPGPLQAGQRLPGPRRGRPAPGRVRLPHLRLPARHRHRGPLRQRRVRPAPGGFWRTTARSCP
jgi:PAS domain S-box-containing protein